MDTFGALDILVNSATVNFLAVCERLSPNVFKTVQEIDTQGVFNMVSCAFEPLKASKFGGVVTNLSGALHNTAMWYQVAPVAAKAAIDTMTRNLATEWTGESLETLLLCSEAERAKVGGNVFVLTKPLQRPGTKAEIASSCPLPRASTSTALATSLWWMVALGSRRSLFFRATWWSGSRAAWKKALGRWAQEHRCRTANFEIDPL